MHIDVAYNVLENEIKYNLIKCVLFHVLTFCILNETDTHKNAFNVQNKWSLVCQSCLHQRLNIALFVSNVPSILQEADELTPVVTGAAEHHTQQQNRITTFDHKGWLSVTFYHITLLKFAEPCVNRILCHPGQKN